jgi:hypothetical protein
MRATLVCVRRVFMSIEAMVVVRKEGIWVSRRKAKK